MALQARIGAEDRQRLEAHLTSLRDLEMRIARMDGDVAQVLRFDERQELRHAVDERLGTDEAVVRPHVGAVCEMLPRAEADLEVKWPVAPEQRPRADFPIGRHFNLRQQLVDQLLLPLAQLVPARPAVQPV